MDKAEQRLSQPILVVAGEASGEMYAADLVRALTDRWGYSRSCFFGCGSTHLQQEGVEILVDNCQLSVLGPFEAISHIGHFLVAFHRLVSESRRRRTKWAILVDFPDFNIPLAKKLKRQGVRVFYFVSPQLWAWRKWRVHQLRELVDKMIVILPFEKEFYAAHGMDVEYFGHPLVDKVKASSTRSQFFEAYRLDKTYLTLSLLPGSRKREIRFNLPTMLRSARRLQWDRPAQFLVPVASPTHRDLVQSLMLSEAPDLSINIVENDTYNSIAHSTLAVVSSGTATLEAALLGTPLITVFRISVLSWIVGKYLIDVPYYSLVNLIAGEEVIPELYQEDFTEEKLYVKIHEFLTNSSQPTRVKMGLAGVRHRLGSGGAITKAAECIAAFIEHWTSAGLYEGGGGYPISSVHPGSSD